MLDTSSSRCRSRSPQRYARAAGALYLVIIILGIFGEAFVRSRIIVAGDIMATAANLRSMESLWRLGIAAEFVSLSCVIAPAMAYFVLLRPVSKELIILATFFRMSATIVEAVAALNLDIALFPIDNAGMLKGFTPEQLAGLANLAIRSHSHGFSLALMFTGFCFLIHGYLIFKSGFLPKALGVMIQLGGGGYLTNSFTLILAPALVGQVFPIIIVPVFIAETSLSLWLLAKGVNVEKWRTAARAAR